MHIAINKSSGLTDLSKTRCISSKLAPASIATFIARAASMFCNGLDGYWKDVNDILLYLLECDDGGMVLERVWRER